jgi:hypothetical protein
MHDPVRDIERELERHVAIQSDERLLVDITLRCVRDRLAITAMVSQEILDGRRVLPRFLPWLTMAPLLGWLWSREVRDASPAAA